MRFFSKKIKPVIYSHEEIDRDLKRVVGNAFFNEPHYHAFFEVMYNIGCRAGEVLDISRWSVGARGVIILVPQKNNNKRLIEPQDIGDVFLNYIYSPESFPSYMTYNRLNYTFRKLSLYHNIFIGEKKSSLHLFRHNYVKNLVERGFSEVEVAEILGEKNLESVLSYTNSKYSNQPI